MNFLKNEFHEFSWFWAKWKFYKIQKASFRNIVIVFSVVKSILVKKIRVKKDAKISEKTKRQMAKNVEILELVFYTFLSLSISVIFSDFSKRIFLNNMEWITEISIKMLLEPALRLYKFFHLVWKSKKRRKIDFCPKRKNFRKL